MGRVLIMTDLPRLRGRTAALRPIMTGIAGPAEPAGCMTWRKPPTSSIKTQLCSAKAGELNYACFYSCIHVDIISLSGRLSKKPVAMSGTIKILNH